MKNQKTKKISLIAFSALLLFSSCTKEEVSKVVDPILESKLVADFEDLTVDEKGYTDSIGLVNHFYSQSFLFQNVYNTDYPGYHFLQKGFALSTLADTITADAKYAAYAGSGSGDSKTYIISTATSLITCPVKAVTLTSIDITNSTYAALSMKNGDQFAKKFSAADKDYLKVWIRGFYSGKVKDSIEVYLANFQSSNPSEHFIQKDWKNVDLTKLNTSDSITFEMESSDNGQFGMNTPGFFALDNLKFIK